MPSCKYSWISYYKHHQKELFSIYDLLVDQLSQETYVEFIKANITNCYYRGYKSRTKEKYFECYTPLKNEVFLNIGSCVGDTIFYFVEKRNEKFEHICAIEADEEKYRNLIHNLNIFPKHIRNKIDPICICLDETNVENIVEKVTLINADIEGAELAVLHGLKNTIIRNRPVLAICAYHKPEDIVEIPKYVTTIVDDYMVYFRKYAAAYSSPLGNGELVIYLVPKERILMQKGSNCE